MIIQQTAAYSAQSASAPLQQKRQETAKPAASIADSVSISPAARDAGTAPAASDQNFPLEYYAIPKWQADLYPVAMSQTLGTKATDLYSKGGDLVRDHPSELAEYGQGLQSHLQAILKKEGIDNPAAYHQAMIVDQAGSERIRLQLQESIAKDPRMGELMNALGISFPG